MWYDKSMNNEETFDFENRTYVNPDLSRDEQTQFIETLRGMQDRNAQEIGRETYALGTNVPSNLGGLGGAEETWNARYQEPQMNEVAAQLKTAAQQTALNNALSNYSNMLQNRYNQAYRDYQKRQYNHQRNLERSSTTTNPTNTDNTTGDKTVFNTNTPEDTSVVSSKDDGLTPIADGYYSYNTNNRTYVLAGADDIDRFNLQGDLRLTNPSQNQLLQKNGRSYIYANGDWYRVTEVGPTE